MDVSKMRRQAWAVLAVKMAKDAHLNISASYPFTPGASYSLDQRIRVRNRLEFGGRCFKENSDSEWSRTVNE